MKYVTLLTLFFLLAWGSPAQAFADAGLRLQEQEIKAGLLYNFLKYVEWPSNSASAQTTTVCVFGDDPFNGYLQPMAGRTVNQRQIAIRNVHDVADAGTCQLLFVNADEKARWPQLVKSLSGKGVLTVADFDDFAASGGMIEFGLKDGHINVRLNLDAVIAAGLHVEDRLLKLVTVVHPGEH